METLPVSFAAMRTGLGVQARHARTRRSELFNADTLEHAEAKLDALVDPYKRLPRI